MLAEERFPIELQGAKCTQSHLEKLTTSSSVAEVQEGVWIAEDWQGNYYHWLIRHLPKLLLCERADLQFPLLLPGRCGMQSVIDESLDLLGWRSDWRVYVDSDVTTIGSGILCQLGSFDRQLLPELSERLRSPFEKSGQAGIFVSRAGASKRRIVGEDQLVSAVESYDIVPLKLEALSFLEQREVMSCARVLVGMHGAGLANMILMPPCSLVVEIIAGETDTTSLYQSLAKVLGHEYCRVPALPIDARYEHNAHVTVEQTELVAAVARGCAKIKPI